MGSMACERNEKNERQKLSNLECVAKTIRNDFFLLLPVQLGTG
jgi:hypothetical protein